MGNQWERGQSGLAEYERERFFSFPADLLCAGNDSGLCCLVNARPSNVPRRKLMSRLAPGSHNCSIMVCYGRASSRPPLIRELRAI